jgi:hypothetical protein
MLLLEPGGLYYDLELKLIAALKARPAFLPILRMLTGIVEYDEAKGIIVTENWQDRNRRASSPLSPVLVHFLAPHGKLYQRLPIVLSQDVQQPLVHQTQRRPGPKDIPSRIPAQEWPTVLQRVLVNHESYRKLAAEYGVSRETIRRLVHAASCG